MRLALHWQILIAMILGAVIGVTLNKSLGDKVTETPIEIVPGSFQPYGFSDPVKLEAGRLWVHDRPGNVEIQFDQIDQQKKAVTRQRYAIAPPGENEHQWPDLPVPEGYQLSVEATQTVSTVGQLQSKFPPAYVMFEMYGRSNARWVGDGADSLGKLFLRMLKMVSIPLIITSLITGVTSLGRNSRLGRMFGRTLVYYLATSILAIFTGLFMFNLIDPGAGEPPLAGAVDEADEAPRAGAKPKQGKHLTTILFEQVENLIPPNPIKAVSSGNFLSIIAFSLAFGVFTTIIGGATAEKISGLFQSLFEVMMKMTLAIVYLAPYGVFMLMLSATATQGLAIFGALGWYMVTVACALFTHAVIVLPLILLFVARRNPLEFAKAMSPALLTAFSSASSNGTLPLTMSSVETRAGVSNRVSSFVLPLGATVNMDGTALYEVIAVLFIANMTPGVDLGLVDQIIVAITALLASIGAAGIPFAGLVMMVVILQAVGLPTESQGLIIAVDRVLDMCRTMVNVWSDSCGCAVISRFEASGDAGAAPSEPAGSMEFQP